MPAQTEVLPNQEDYFLAAEIAEAGEVALSAESSCEQSFYDLVETLEQTITDQEITDFLDNCPPGKVSFGNDTEQPGEFTDDAK